MIDLGKFHHDLTVLPNPGIMVYVREMIPFYGRTIQVSEKYIIYPDIMYICMQIVDIVVHNCVYMYIYPIFSMSGILFLFESLLG